jgi:hypothetical protein
MNVVKNKLGTGQKLSDSRFVTYSIYDTVPYLQLANSGATPLP